MHNSFNIYIYIFIKLCVNVSSVQADKKNMLKTIAV